MSAAITEMYTKKISPFEYFLMYFMLNIREPLDDVNIKACVLYSRHDRIVLFKKKSYLKFLVAQNCIKKDLEIYYFLLKKVIAILR